MKTNTNREIPYEVLELLKYLSSKHGALIYGGGSLIIRSILKNEEHYRFSTDIDIKKVGVTKKSSGPRSQIKPLNLDEELKKRFTNNITCKEIENQGESKGFNYHLTFSKELSRELGFNELNLEFFLEKNIDENCFEIIEGFRLVKISKLLADKIYATLESYKKEIIETDNLVRHLVDIMIVPKTFDISKNFKQEVIKFLSERIENEQSFIDKQNEHDRNSLNIIAKQEVNNNILLVWKDLVEDWLMFDASFEKRNEEIKSNQLYRIDYDIYTDENINS